MTTLTDIEKEIHGVRLLTPLFFTKENAVPKVWQEDRDPSFAFYPMPFISSRSSIWDVLKHIKAEVMWIS